MVYYRRIFLIFVFLMFLFITTCQAAVLTYTTENYTFVFDTKNITVDSVEVMRDFKYVCLAQRSDGHYDFIVSNNPFNIMNNRIYPIYKDFDYFQFYVANNALVNVSENNHYKITFNNRGGGHTENTTYKPTYASIGSWSTNQTFKKIIGNTGTEELNMTKPYFISSSEGLKNGNFNYVQIDGGDYTSSNFQNFYLVAYEKLENNEYIQKSEIELNLNENPPYNVYPEEDGTFLFTVPRNLLNLNLRNNYSYSLKLANKSDGQFQVFASLDFTVSGMTIQDSVDNGFSDVNDPDINPDINLPTDNSTDITSSGFDNIFNTIYNTISGTSSNPYVITLPFVNKSFTISKETVYGNLNLGLLGTLINTVWFFIVSIFIVKDISKKINKIKSGNIDNIENNNIKEDML